MIYGAGGVLDFCWGAIWSDWGRGIEPFGLYCFLFKASSDCKYTGLVRIHRFLRHSHLTVDLNFRWT
jgi:hypothetical protein